LSAVSDIQRPVFFEGQILAAADLTDTVEHERARAARHERLLHDWGITYGLTLTKVAKVDAASGKPYVEVTVEPGMATDGTGRDIVVGDRVPLSTTLFEQVNRASLQPDAYYPVVLHGFDDEAPQPAFSAAACGPSAGAKRVAEAFEVTFRRIGDAAGFDDQPVPDITAGPGPLGGQNWDILLGFVQWDDGIQQFTNVTERAGGIGRRYAGVKADSVAARGGRLELRPNRSREVGEVAVVVGGDPPGLIFGVYQGDGTVDERLTITAKGDLAAKGDIKSNGVITGRLTAGQIRVQSGTATDGIVLPLPPGVAQEELDRGAVVLHIWVTIRASLPIPPANFPIGPFPRECFVDNSRRLHCLVRWLNTAGTNAQNQAAAADYLVVAVGAQGSGAGP
jgi:hypothetical protein